MRRRPPRIVVGKHVYRFVQAQDVPEAFQDAKDTPEKDLEVEAIAQKMDQLKAEMKDELDKAGVELAGEPRYITTGGGFRLMAETNAKGALEGTTGMITFDFAVGWVYDLRNESKLADQLGINQYWQRMFSLNGWKEVGLSLVAWDWCGMNFVAGEVQGDDERPADYSIDPTKLMKGLLGSIATLQKVNARTQELNLEPGAEADDEVLKDWALNQAIQMLQHAVSAEQYALHDAVKMAVHNMLGKELDAFEVNYVIAALKELEEQSEGANVVSIRNLQEKLKKDKKLSEQSLNKVLERTQEFDLEPEQIFNREKFLKTYSELIPNKQLIAKLEKGLQAFESNQEWEDALRSAAEAGHGPAPLEDQVKAAIKQLTPEAKYAGRTQIAIADDGSIVAQIQAPFPFYYRFEHEAGNLRLLEAAMEICDRTPLVSEEDGNLALQEELLKADVYLAAAYGQAAGQDTPKGTQPKKASDLAEDLVRLITDKRDESKKTAPKEAFEPAPAP